ncbi:MAG: YfhO family protein, partial [Dehalococcoidales bacterium]|nr:YfhO family protein [Dehalococcoidales bacterium]
NDYGAGRFPLWNETQGFGSPLLANTISGAMDVLRLPLLLDGSPLTWDFYYLARSLLGLLLGYMFARTIHLGRLASFLVAEAYVFSGHFMAFSNNNFVEVYLLLPSILLGTELVIQGRRRLGFVTTAVGVSASILAGMPESTLFVLLLSAGYGGYRFLLVARQSSGHRTRLGLVAALVGGWLTGLSLAAPMMLTFLEYLPVSSSIHSPERQLGLAYDQLSGLIFLAMPFIRGLPRAPLAPDTAVVMIHTYAGTTVLMLAIYGLVAGVGERRRQVVVFFALAAALLLAKSYGVPGINEIGRLPGLLESYIPHWSAPVSGFCLALLAGFGVDCCLSSRKVDARATWAYLAFLVYTLVGLWLNRVVLATAPIEHLIGTVGLGLLLALTTWRVLRIAFVLPAMWRGLVLLALVSVELFVYAPRNVYQDRFSPLEPPFAAFIRSYQASDYSRIFAQDGILFPNNASSYGIQDVRALDALYVDRYLRYIADFVAPGVTDRFTGAPYASDEKQTLLLGNPWFDLTGVRFILTRPGADDPNRNRPLVNEILLANAGALPRATSAESFTIDGISKPVLVEYPPASLALPLTVTPGRSTLRFSLALDPRVWDSSKGDGVGFEVAVAVDGKTETAYARQIDAKHEGSMQQHWTEGYVDLSRFLFQDVVLILRTDPLNNTDNDRAGWGDIRLTPMSDEMAQSPINRQYVKVYDGEVEIYENRHALPRAFLVGNVIPVAGPEAAVATMKQSQVDPARTAIVEGLTLQQADTANSGEGTATIRNYVSTDVTIDINAVGDSLLVLTDSYYPGWTATVDGHEVPIYATDLAFRGVFVPKGQHVVSFSYQPTSFSVGMGLAVAAFIVLVLVAAGLVPWRWRGGRPSQAPRRPEADETPG